MRSYADSSAQIRPEQLLVKWQTVGKSKTKTRGADWLAGGGNGATGRNGEDNDRNEFTGLFIFEFDSEGRIVSHTIENVEEGGNWERGVGAKVVGLTDWLLGGMKNGRGEEGTPCPAFSATVEEGETSCK